MSLSSPNWQALAEQTVRYLRDLIRLDTTNPPGNEIVAAEYIAGVLRAASLDPIVIETAPRRGNVIARLTGDGSPRRCCCIRTPTSCLLSVSIGRPIRSARK